MSLIMGVHLLERIYLISDTRLTYDENNYKDDLIKVFKFNDRISAIAAGKALAASFLLNRIRELINENTTVHEIKEIISLNFKKIISEYVNKTGYHSGSVAIIVGGFNLEKNKRIEVSQLGRAMSAMIFASKKEGVGINQSVDKRLLRSFGQLSGKGKGSYITVNNVQDAELFSFSLDISNGTISHSEDAECYQYLIFHPDQNVIKIQLPDEIISLLEFRDRRGNSSEDTLYQDAEILINFVRRVVRENGFLSVGGHVFTILQFPVGAIFPTGDFARIAKGRLVKAGSIVVDNGVLMYELDDGTRSKYRHLEQLSKRYLHDKDFEDMLI